MPTSEDTATKPSPTPRPRAEEVPEEEGGIIEARKPLLRPGVLGAAVLVLLVAGAAVYGWLRIDKLSDAEGARNSALRAGTDYAVAISTYDFKDPKANLDAVVAHATDKFAAEYRDASGKLTRLIQQAQASAQGTVLKAAVADADDNTAVVIAFLDQSIKNSNLKEPRVDRSRMQLTLTRSGHEWRLDEARSL